MRFHHGRRRRRPLRLRLRQALVVHRAVAQVERLEICEWGQGVAPHLGVFQAQQPETGGESRDLIDPGVVASREDGSRFQLTIWVDDADAACAQLVTHGVGLLNGPMNREWGMRTASFTDPDGHIWEIAQEIT